MFCAIVHPRASVTRHPRVESHSPSPAPLHSDPNNFGHIFIDDFASAFSAMQLFDRVTYRNRIVFAPPCFCCGEALPRCTRGYTRFVTRPCPSCACLTRRARSWIQGLSHLPAVALDDYPDGTCFRTMFVGHASALSQAYYSPLRGASISLFREAFIRNYMHGVWRMPSLQGNDGGGLPEDAPADGTVAAAAEVGQPGLSAAAAAPHQHVIFIHNKTKDSNAPGFRCALCLYVPSHIPNRLTLVPPAATCGRTCVPCSMKSVCWCLAAVLSASTFRAWTSACKCRRLLKQHCT